PCLLYPRKRTCAVHQLMSALGQKQTHAPQQKGTDRSRHVRCTRPCPLYPQSGHMQCSSLCPLWANSRHLAVHSLWIGANYSWLIVCCPPSWHDRTTRLPGGTN